MKFEKLLIFVSLLNFLLGFSLLVYLTYSSEAIKLSPNEISENYLNKKVEVCGKIEKIVEKEKVNFIYLEIFSNFFVVAFPDVYNLVKNKLETDKNICVRGTLTLYNGNFEIILTNPNKLTVYS